MPPALSSISHFATPISARLRRKNLSSMSHSLGLLPLATPACGRSSPTRSGRLRYSSPSFARAKPTSLVGPLGSPYSAGRGFRLLPPLPRPVLPLLPLATPACGAPRRATLLHHHPLASAAQ